MTPADLISLLEFARKRTNGTLDAIAKLPNPAAALGWRPGPGRAHAAWQLMHIAATDDKHLNVRLKKGTAADAELVRRFAGGSIPDDTVPTVDEIRAYLAARRAAMVEHLSTLKESDLGVKPSDDLPWAYGEWVNVLAWHEAHHQGQAHLTLNLYKAAHPE